MKKNLASCARCNKTRESFQRQDEEPLDDEIEKCEVETEKEEVSEEVKHEEAEDVREENGRHRYIHFTTNTL